MFKKLWKKIKKSLGNQPTSRKVEAPRFVPVQSEVDNGIIKPAKLLASAAATSNGMTSTTEAARPARSAGACPAYAAKSVVGQRMTMEDSWQAVPDLLAVPKWWTCNARDHLPPLVVAPAPAEGTADPQPAQQGQLNGASSDTPSLTAETVSVPCAKPAEASSGAGTGQTVSRPAMEPKQLAEKHGTDPVTVHFFAVYDGHGGPDVAKHCAKNLHEHLKTVVVASVGQDGLPKSGPLTPPTASLVAGDASDCARDPDGPSAACDAQPVEVWPARVDGIEAALKAAFLHTDTQLAQNRSAHEVGTTAVVSLVTLRTLWVGNCGDSRALLCREKEAVALSLDHKATRIDEVSRVEQAGGYVWWDRVMGELAVSRAIGDHCLRPFVIAEPEITSVVRRPEDLLLIMASDGLWDVFTNEEARTLALEKFSGELQRTSSSKMAVKKAASSLAKAAISKGSRDNVTVVVVDMRLQGASSSGHNGAAAHASATRSSGTPRAGPLQSGSGVLPTVAEQQQQQQKQVAASPSTPAASDEEV